MQAFDLHTHSIYSDGTQTPAAIVRAAKEAGLAFVALTDHDTVMGVPEAMAEGARIGMRVVPGVEYDIDYSVTMHILGLGIDPDAPEVKRTLAESAVRRARRNKAMFAPQGGWMPDRGRCGGGWAYYAAAHGERTCEKGVCTIPRGGVRQVPAQRAAGVCAQRKYFHCAGGRRHACGRGHCGVGASLPDPGRQACRSTRGCARWHRWHRGVLPGHDGRGAHAFPFPCTAARPHRDMRQRFSRRKPPGSHARLCLCAHAAAVARIQKVYDIRQPFNRRLRQAEQAKCKTNARFHRFSQKAGVIFCANASPEGILCTAYGRKGSAI